MQKSKASGTKFSFKALLALCVAMGLVAIISCSTDVSENNSNGSTAAAPQKVNADEVRVLMEEEGVVLLDVRTPEEYTEAHIGGAVLLPVDDIDKESASEVIPDQDTKVIVYCRTGVRSSNAAQTLSGLGYKNVYNLGGITTDWPYEVESGASAN